jgi:hypothetical protein
VLRTCSVRAPYVLHAFVRFACFATNTASRFGGLEWETAQRTYRLGTIASPRTTHSTPFGVYLSSMGVAFGRTNTSQSDQTGNYCLLPLQKLPTASRFVSHASVTAIVTLSQKRAPPKIVVLPKCCPSPLFGKVPPTPSSEKSLRPPLRKIPSDPLFNVETKRRPGELARPTDVRESLQVPCLTSQHCGGGSGGLP